MLGCDLLVESHCNSELGHVYRPHLYFPHLPHSLCVSCEESRACGRRNAVGWWIKEPSHGANRNMSEEITQQRCLCSIITQRAPLLCLPAAPNLRNSHYLLHFVERQQKEEAETVALLWDPLCLWPQEMLTGSEAQNPEGSTRASETTGPRHFPALKLLGFSWRKVIFHKGTISMAQEISST